MKTSALPPLRGAFLLELILVISIINILLLSSIYSLRTILSKLHLHYFSVHCLHFFHSIRLLSSVTDQDLIIFYDKPTHAFQVRSVSYDIIDTLPIPNSLLLTKSSPNGIGFKPSGSHRHSGSFVITNSHAQKKISLGIQLGKLSLK